MRRNQELPNFFIIGAPKCGTTSLYHYLRQHPDVYLPENKEPKFFCDDTLYIEGLELYRNRFFHDARHYTHAGDASPHYLYYHKAARRIQKDLPEDSHRFIVMLRDPVARAYSHYWNMVYEGFETLTFEQALAEEQSRIRNNDYATRGVLNAHYVACGMYAKQLERWFEVFDRDRFLFLFQRDLAEHPRELMAAVYRFLGVADIDVDTGAVHNPSGRARSIGLQRWLRQPSRLRRIVGPFIPYTLRYRLAVALVKLNRKTASYPPLDERIAEALRQRFLPDIEQLEQITETDLSDWKPGAGSNSCTRLTTETAHPGQCAHAYRRNVTRSNATKNGSG